MSSQIILLIGAVLLIGHLCAAEPKLNVIRSELGPCNVHGTTRGHQRKVVYINGAWLVAYSNEQGSHLRLSRDGLHWTEPLTFHPNETSSSYTLVMWKGRLFLFYTDFRSDSPQREWKGDGIVVREVMVQDEGVKLKDEPQPVLIDPEGTDFYLSAAVGPDGTFWVQSRHVDRSSPTASQDTRLTRTITPGRLTGWTEPIHPIPLRAKGSIVPLVVPLRDGKAYSFARTYQETETNMSRLWGNLFDGRRWGERPSVLARMTDVLGDDRRMSAVFDAKSGLLHLIYIDEGGVFRHRQLYPPYQEESWQPPLSQPGREIYPAPVHCAVASLDPHVSPSRVYVVFGRELRVGHDPRHRTGELRLAVFDGSNWRIEDQPVSEPGATDCWYPNVSAKVNPAGELGVLYLKGWEKGRYRAHFTLMRVR
jgi:hypothetical protein